MSTPETTGDIHHLHTAGRHLDRAALTTGQAQNRTILAAAGTDPEQNTANVRQAVGDITQTMRTLVDAATELRAWLGDNADPDTPHVSEGGTI